MAYNEVAKKATIKYIKEKLRQYTIRFNKEDYEQRIAPAIEASGMNVSAFIKEAIDEKIGRDGPGSPKAEQAEKSPIGGHVIVIQEMENLPNNCHECPLSYCDDENCDYWCPWYHCTVDAHGGETRRMDGCPLQEREA